MNKKKNICKKCNKKKVIYCKGLCKICYNRQYAKKRKENNPDYFTKRYSDKIKSNPNYNVEIYDKIKNKRKRNNKLLNEIQKRYNLNNPKIIIAQRLAQKIKIPKNKKCEVCSVKKAIEKHHEDYNKPLEVNFLCRNCHNKIHRKYK